MGPGATGFCGSSVAVVQTGSVPGGTGTVVSVSVEVCSVKIPQNEQQEACLFLLTVCDLAAQVLQRLRRRQEGRKH